MPASNEQPLRIGVADDGIATLTLDRPDKRNALSIALRDALASWIEDSSVRALDVARQIAEAPQRTLQATKRYLAGNQGFGFEDSFRVEHDDVFDNFLGGGLEAGA